MIKRVFKSKTELNSLVIDIFHSSRSDFKDSIFHPIIIIIGSFIASGLIDPLIQG